MSCHACYFLKTKPEIVQVCTLYVFGVGDELDKIDWKMMITAGNNSTQKWPITNASGPKRIYKQPYPLLSIFWTRGQT